MLIFTPGSISNVSDYQKKMLQELQLIIVKCVNKLVQARPSVSAVFSCLCFIPQRLMCFPSLLGSYEAPSTFDDLPSIPTEAPPSSPPQSPRHAAAGPSATSLPSLLSNNPSALPLPPMPSVLTPSDSGDERENADDGDYFASRAQEAESSRAGGAISKDNANRTSSNEVEDEDDDDFDDGAGPTSGTRRRTTATGTRAPSSSTSRLPQRRKSSSAGANNAKRRKRVVEDDDEAEERRKKASASTKEVSLTVFVHSDGILNLTTVIYWDSPSFTAVLRKLHPNPAIH
jgi:hypothetical protein